MSDGKILEFSNVTKRFDGVAAVAGLTATVEPGYVTAFLGPNGAGKTTTLRILTGQLRADSGTATVDGKPVSQLSQPRRSVGWVSENPTFRARRTANKHLASIARQAGVSVSRVGEVLDLVGLSEVADMRISTYSLGMVQRLAVAEAMMGDPGALVLDEPANGLDPEGIRWMRLLMRKLADEGRTVLVSSHLLSEVQQVADRLLVLTNGSLVFSGGVEELEDAFPRTVVVDSTDRAALSRVLRAEGLSVRAMRSGVHVNDVSTGDIGAIAARESITLTSLSQRAPSLEEVFLRLVSGEWRPATPGTSDVTDSAEATGASESVPADVEPEPNDTAPDAATTADDADGETTAEAAETALADIEVEPAHDPSSPGDGDDLPLRHRSTWQAPSDADGPDVAGYVSPLADTGQSAFDGAAPAADNADSPDSLEVADDTVMLPALDEMSDHDTDAEQHDGPEHASEAERDVAESRSLPGTASLAGFLAGEEQKVSGAGAFVTEPNDDEHNDDEHNQAEPVDVVTGEAEPDAQTGVFEASGDDDAPTAIMSTLQDSDTEVADDTAGLSFDDLLAGLDQHEPSDESSDGDANHGATGSGTS